MAMAKVLWSTTAGLVLGIAKIVVMPPASAAAVQDAKSSLWTAPGSRVCTCTSIRPGSLIILRDDTQSVCVFIRGAFPPTILNAYIKDGISEPIISICYLFNHHTWNIYLHFLFYNDRNYDSCGRQHDYTHGRAHQIIIKI